MHSNNLFLTVLITFFVLVSVSNSVYAGDSINPPLVENDEGFTIDELIDIALENHASYRKQVEDNQVIKDGLKVAYSQFLPSVTLSAGYSDLRDKNPDTEPFTNPLTGRVVDQSLTKSSYSSLRVSLNQNLFQGGYRYYGIERAKLMLQNSDLYTRATRNEIAYAVKSSVYSVLAAEKINDVAADVLEFRKEAYRLANARFANGDVIELDVLQAEIDLGNAQNDVLNAELSLRNAREALNYACGIRLDSSFPIKGVFDPDLPTLETNSLVNEGMTESPTLKWYTKNVLINEQNVKMAKANMLPSVDLSMSMTKKESGEGYNKFALSPVEENRTVSLGISWTVFNRFESKYRTQQAVVEKRKAEWDKREEELKLESSLRSGIRDLTRLFEQIKVTDKNRELARRQLNLEQERYRLGASSQLNLRSAQVTFIEAENQHIAKVFEFFTTKALLEKNLGRSLEEVTQ